MQVAEAIELLSCVGKGHIFMKNPGCSMELFVADDVGRGVSPSPPYSLAANSVCIST